MHDTSVICTLQLGDGPRTLDPAEAEGEFRQHDGVVTMMMFYQRRASPKLRDDMTEVEYGGGGHRTRLKINLCVYGVPPPPYIKEGRRGPAGHKGRAQGGNPTPSRSRFPPFLVQVGEEGRRGRGRGKEGPRPLPKSNSDSSWRGAPPPGLLPSLSPVRPTKAQYFPGGFR